MKIREHFLFLFFFGGWGARVRRVWFFFLCRARPGRSSFFLFFFFSSRSKRAGVADSGPLLVPFFFFFFPSWCSTVEKGKRVPPLFPLVRSRLTRRAGEAHSLLPPLSFLMQRQSRGSCEVFGNLANVFVPPFGALCAVFFSSLCTALFTDARCSTT